jgi:hypothetical protein
MGSSKKERERESERGIYILREEALCMCLCGPLCI